MPRMKCKWQMTCIPYLPNSLSCFPSTGKMNFMQQENPTQVTYKNEILCSRALLLCNDLCDKTESGTVLTGKYVPAISYKIHQENQKTPHYKINFKGIAIGDGFCDPHNM